eukprot:c20610_g1_i10 orf=376-525(-)
MPHVCSGKIFMTTKRIGTLLCQAESSSEIATEETRNNDRQKTNLNFALF